VPTPDDDDTQREPTDPPGPVPGIEGGAARYDLAGQIGRGGMGAVFRARDARLERDVALKVLLEEHQARTELRDRFVEEARIAGQLQHPGIAPVYDVGELGDRRPYFTMRLVEGKTLAALLAARSSPQDDLAGFVRIFQQVCQTMAYAHARRIVHRDLKPGNVMVGAFGEVQVMDWGLAKVVTPEGEESPAAEESKGILGLLSGVDEHANAFWSSAQGTRSGRMVGTPAYMAPEQACGAHVLVDERSDVFGLGAILFEILTGSPPYSGTAAEMQEQARAGDLQDGLRRLDGSGADPELAGIAKRCLEKEPWERPENAGAVAAAVTSYLSTVAERLRQAELRAAADRARAEEESKRRRVTAAFAVTILAAVLAGGGVWLHLRGEQAARQRALERDVRQALDLALEAQSKARAGKLEEVNAWTEAREQAQRAQAFLEGGRVDLEIESQVRRLLAELRDVEKDRQLLVALAEARLRQTEPILEKDRFNVERAVPLYRAAFRAYGVDCGGQDVAPLARSLEARGKEVLEAVVSVLDEWVLFAEAPGMDVNEPCLPWLRELLAAADPDPWRQAVRRAGALQDWTRVREELKDLAAKVDVAAQPPRALTSVALRLSSLDEHSAVVELLQRAALAHPGDFWVQFYLSLALHRSGDHQRALPHAWAAFALQPGSTGVWLALGASLTDAGRKQEAVDLLRSGLVRFPGDPGIANTLCQRLIEDLPDPKRLDEARSILEKSLALRGDHAWTHKQLGYIALQQGRLGDYIQSYTRALALDPSDTLIRCELGMALMQAGDAERGRDELQRAAEECRRALVKAPRSAEHALLLGKALAGLGQVDESIESLRAAVKLDPSSEIAHSDLGAQLLKKLELDQAAEHFRRAIAVSPLAYPAYANLGSVHRALGQVHEARRAFAKAAELRPEWAELHNEVGVCDLQLDDRAGAIQAFQRAVAADPKSVSAQSNLGWACILERRFDEAVKALEGACRLDPRQCQPEGMARGLLDLVPRHRALAGDLDRILQGGAPWPSPAEALPLAEMSSVEGKHRLAVRFFETAFAGPIDLTPRPGAQRRSMAAASAAWVAAGRPGDGEPVSREEALRLGRQAVGWFQADLDHVKLLAGGDGKAHREAFAILNEWLVGRGIASLRDREEIAKLPEELRPALERFAQETFDLYRQLRRE
jgi:serine/threonine-protein kinase